ncbi:oligosaccharide flippase family protein [Polaromonas eurypsychrophila]|nr:oligosaccharide flippase family protein [Polaromonas eurypsychrophila]
MVLDAEGRSTVRTFWRSVGVVLTGTVAAQSIPLLGSLVIARIYAPAEFGLFSAWLGMVMMAAVVVTGRFEMTLAVEPDGAPRRFAVAATLGTILLASSFFALITGGIYLAGGLLDDVQPAMVGLFVPAALLAGVTHTWQAWSAAEGNYRGLSWIRISQAFVVTAAQIGAGLISPTAFGMTLGHVLGTAAGIGFAVYFMPLNPLLLGGRAEFWTKLKAFWRNQRRFPMLALPADALNAASGQLPLLLIASRFGAEASGLFALTLRVLGAPIGLLGAAVLDVFKRSAASSYREKGHCRDEYARTFWLLAAGGCVLALGVIVVAERLFVVAFGEPWRQAGIIAIWLMPMFAFRFVASPLSYVFYIAGKQQIDLVWQCALFAMTLASFMLTSSFETSIKFYSAGYSLLYVIYAILSYHYSKGKQS